MEFRGVCVLLGVLLLATCSSQQSSARRKPQKKDATQETAIEEIKKQIDDIVVELNLLKEQQALQTVCLKGIKIQGKCFLADRLKKSYHVASEDCNSMGGVLGTPSSQSENDQLRDYIRQSIGTNNQVWLGVNDMVTEGVWKDQSTATVSYTNWDTTNRRSPQPNGGSSQNCVVLSTTVSGKWFDENCRDEKASVCQFNIV